MPDPLQPNNPGTNFWSPGATELGGVPLEPVDLSQTLTLGPIGPTGDVYGPSLILSGNQTLTLGTIGPTHVVAGPTLLLDQRIDLGAIGPDGAAHGPYLSLSVSGPQTLTLGQLGPTSDVAGPTATGSPATLTLGAVNHRALPFGPYLDVLRPAGDPVPPSVTATLFDPTNTNPVDDLETSFARQWQDPHNDTGTGAVSVPVDDDSFDYDRVVRFSVDGRARFAAIIEDVERTWIDRGEESQQVTVARGRGLAGELDRVIVFPANGIDFGGVAGPEGAAFQPWSPTRVFNFASKHFDDTAWGPIYVQASGIPALGGGPASVDMRPSKWPDPYSQWVWSQGQGNSHPAGDCYFRAPFTVPVPDPYGPTQVAVFCTADDNFELWIDDVTVLNGEGSQDSQVANWEGTFHAAVSLMPGDHTLAIKATNYDLPLGSIFTELLPPGFPFGNVAGLICSIWTTLQDHRIDTLLNLTNPDPIYGWKSIAYPNPVPGFTAGKIMRVLFEEAQGANRNRLTDWTLDFDDTTDSAGRGWANIPEFVVNVGDDYLKVLQQLAENYVDWHVPPGGKVLRMWDKEAGGRGATRSVSLVNTGDVDADNLTSLVIKGTTR